MSVPTVKKMMLTRSQKELSQRVGLAQQIKSISASATFSVGQEVVVVQKTKRTAGVIVKMNPKKAVVSMVVGRSQQVSQVSVPFSMLEAA